MYHLTRGVLALMIGFIISIVVGVVIVPLLKKIKVKQTLFPLPLKGTSIQAKIKERFCLSFFLFFDGQQHSCLLLVFGKARLAGLPVICHWDTDRQEQHSIGHCACAQIPSLRKSTYHAQANAPPHKDLAQVIGMAGIFPQSAADKSAGFCLAESVHLEIRCALEHHCACRQA